ncbi:MAG: L-seryl-tRNA(Sec) selenium transferase [Candidatus Latescibacterota bacterium]|nr:L-seryl-tRNA(Sec) selenium transferase [Candidatus Latescibacterota bacterium]
MSQLRHLPSVDQLLQLDSITELLESYRREVVVQQVRDAVETLRQQLLDAPVNSADREDLLQSAERLIVDGLSRRDPGLSSIVQAAGVILHTGLGRAPLAPAAAQAIAQAAEGYCALEFNLETGERGSRLDSVDGDLRSRTGAEATLVVNNNTAAVLLLLSALAQNREVVISRGELVEIGGAFRMPDIIAASGARICEVGTTNRTHLRDYEAAINADTALILVVHPSNYRVEGFTAAPNPEALVALGHEAGIPVAYDLGGGALFDLERWELPHEPVVAHSLHTGFDVVTFSGDKILGGPQCGIAAGRKDVIGAMRQHPMMRALRCDKLTLAGLRATLQIYALPDDQLRAALPVLRMMTEPVAQIRARAERLLALVPDDARQRLGVQVEASECQVGGGAITTEVLPSFVVALAPVQLDVGEVARRLRLDPVTPVVGRVAKDRVLLDLRTVSDADVESIADALTRVVQSRS